MLEEVSREARNQKKHMSLADFIKVQWGDCRHHNAVLAIMMEGAKIKNVQYRNNQVTVTTTDSLGKKSRKVEDHIVLRYQSANGKFSTVDSYFRNFDGLFIASGRIDGDIATTGTGLRTQQPSGMQNVFCHNSHSERRADTDFRASTVRREAKVLPYPLMLHTELPSRVRKTKQTSIFQGLLKFLLLIPLM